MFLFLALISVITCMKQAFTIYCCFYWNRTNTYSEFALVYVSRWLIAPQPTKWNCGCVCYEKLHTHTHTHTHTHRHPLFDEKFGPVSHLR